MNGWRRALLVSGRSATAPVVLCSHIYRSTTSASSATILAGAHRTTTGRQVPSCLYTDPELAHVGLDESQAKQQGIPYRLAKIPMAAVLRTRAMSETRGFLKVLVAATDDQILGFTGFGEGAGETMATVQLAMRAGIRTPSCAT
jgi:pyruvate/2-oxoglutarate dehydrogenase complex dihydrolipoamide dehydrogenase (E3) component